MTNRLLNALRKTAFRYVYIQATVVSIVSALLYLYGRADWSFSLFLGGMVCVLPNLYFAYKLFLQTGAQDIRLIVKAFYFGEIVKFLLTILFFYIAFKYLNVSKLPFFIGFFIAQFSFGVGALLLRNRKVVK
jgi:ATP synthase protein I